MIPGSILRSAAAAGESRATRKKVSYRCRSRDAAPVRFPPFYASPVRPRPVREGEHWFARFALAREMVSVARSLGLGSRWRSSARFMVTFTAPPDELEEGYFERPTPLLLVAGEGQPAEWWSGTASFFADRGCTVGTMALQGRGSSSTETLTLRALQAGVAAAVDKSGLTPPVIIAHSMAGFVCQQYLQSYSASGLVLLDSYPPSPSALATGHLLLARAGERRDSTDPAATVNAASVTPKIAQQIKEDPERWEGLLGRYFSELQSDSPWTLPYHGDGAKPSPTNVSQDLAAGNSGSYKALRPPFPAKAFAQMCLGLPSATVRLERHVVDTLVLGSKLHVRDGTSSSSGRDVTRDVQHTREEGFAAICEFHGSDSWRLVDEKGFVDGPEGVFTWQEEVWRWYHARF